jgi:hypothetical protein
MERTPVQSSQIVSIGHCPITDDLEVEFKSGIYTYFDVPARVHAGLMAADSVGKYLNAHVKNKYRWEKAGSVSTPLAAMPIPPAEPDAVMDQSLMAILKQLDQHESTLYRTDVALPDGRFLSVVIGLGDVGRLVSQEARGWAVGTEKAFYPAEAI